MICPLTTVVLAVSNPHEHWLTVSSDIGIKKVAVIIDVVSKFDVLNPASVFEQCAGSSKSPVTHAKEKQHQNKRLIT
jgi:hypothetical protein